MKKILFTAYLSIAAVCSMAHAADIKVAAVEFNPSPKDVDGNIIDISDMVTESHVIDDEPPTLDWFIL